MTRIRRQRALALPTDGGPITLHGALLFAAIGSVGERRSGHGFDRSHAEAAIRDAPHALHAGSITKAEEEEIDRKAEAKLDKHPTRIAIRKASQKVHAREAAK